ncbi:hypothetical protein OROMI_000981 [Orobanche minor]
MGTIHDDPVLLFSSVHHHPSSAAPITIIEGSTRGNRGAVRPSYLPLLQESSGVAAPH